MNPLEILIPFALPPTEHANDLINMLSSQCGTDGLAMLLSRHQSLMRTQYDDFSPMLPHETYFNNWLNEHQHSSLLPYYADIFNINLTPGHWFLLTPIHLHIAQSHLVLTDYRHLKLSESDALLLFENAKKLGNEFGVELHYGNASIWFLRADEWSDLVTSSPDAACGHNIDIWSAKGSQERAWRKLQNDIQMEWFIHPIQQQRETRGEQPVNSLWIWSGITLPHGHQAKSNHLIYSTPTTKKLDDLFPNSTQLILFDQLSSAALSDDWHSWIECMIELEHNCFKPLYAALKKQQLHQQTFRHCQLHLSNSNTLISIQLNCAALKKFWRTATFKNLMT